LNVSHAAAVRLLLLLLLGMIGAASHSSVVHTAERVVVHGSSLRRLITE